MRDEIQKIQISKAAEYLGISVDTLRRWDKSGKFTAKKSTGGHRYYYLTDLALFRSDIFALATQWVLGPAVEPQKEFYCPTSTEFKGRLSKLQVSLQKITMLTNYYPLIVATAGEIGNNSYDHNLGNWPDISGAFFAFDMNKRQIALADRGRGVLRTLKFVKPGLKNDTEALHTAFTETISGRTPEARGNGLKFVAKVTSTNPIKLSFYSGNAIIVIKDSGEKMTITETDKYYSGCLALLTF